MTIKQTPVQVNGSEVIVWEDSQDKAVSLSFGGGGWMPGIFDSFDSAVIGASVILKDEDLFVKRLQDEVNHKDRKCRLITMQDLAEFMVRYWSP